MIAAGGLATVDDIGRCRARKGAPIAGAILGRALYTGAITPARRSPPPARRGPPEVLKVRVIPCLDVKDGRVVKGVKFVAAARRRRSGGAGPRL